MPFVPIELEKHVTKFLANNPGSERSEVSARLKETLAEFKAGARCACGAPIWVIGSAEVGHACFMCITGEALSDCNAELSRGSFLRMEKQKPLCLECADLDHLVFLSRDDVALTKRSRKYSNL